MLVDEKVVMSSQDDSLVLTNLRVKLEQKTKSKSTYKSIPLDQVSVCVLDTRTYPVLLVLAVVAVLVVFVAPEVAQRVGAGLLAVGLVVAYFLTRNGQIQIFASAGESIAVPTKGLQHDQIKSFLEAVEMQRLNNK